MTTPHGKSDGSIITKESEGSSPNRKGKESRDGKESHSQIITVHATKQQRERDARQISRANLESASQICFLQDNPRTTIRRIELNQNELFDGLVEVYTMVFATHYPLFSRVKPVIQGATLKSTCQALARVYISGWFYDLYYTLRKATELKDIESYQDKYSTEAGRWSDIYDPYLVQLNALLCPVTVLGTLEESIFVPILTITATTNGRFTFPINHFASDYIEFHAIVAILNERKEFRTEQLKSPLVSGRPIWLLDWWNTESPLTRANTWLPLEGNFSLEDVVIAYIVGGPITPLMAPVDMDDYQVVDEAFDPATDDPSMYERITPRHFFGAFEERNVINNHALIASRKAGSAGTSQAATPSKKDLKKRKRAQTGSSSSTAIVTVPSYPAYSPQQDKQEDFEVAETDMIQIQDYCYYANVIRHMSPEQRFYAIKPFVFT